MSNLTTRAGKGSPLTNNELDANFTNLNADKVEIGGDLSGTSSAPNVAKIQGRAVSADAPAIGEKLVWNGTAWEPSADPTNEPIGHEDKSSSSISFNSGTRTFTISPVAANFVVWCKGVKYTYTSAQTVVIPDTTGLHFIYFNASGVLSTQMSYFTWEEHAPTAYVYWNATTQQAVYFGDERHGITLDWQTHEYLHRTRGAAIASGFGASGYTTTGAGATDADAQIDIGGGTFFDEDLQVDIVSTNTPVAGTWQQDLSGPARIPVLYLSGSAWVVDAPTNFPFKVVSGVPQYNLYSGGSWSTAPVTNNEYFVSWILATHNLTYPVIAVISQAPTNQLSAAEAMTFEGLNLNGFPSVEFRPLYKVIYQYKSGFTNSVKASTIAVYDIRSIAAAGVAAALVQDHGNLSGLGDDDHAQYLHVSEVRSPSSAVKNSFLPSQTSQSGKYLTTDGSNPSWGSIPSGSLTFTGDVTGSGTTGSSTTLTLANSGASAGTYTKVTVDAKGRVTTGASINSSDVTTALGFTPENSGNKGVANGYASLDGSGKVPSVQLPSYVDDVLEYANLAAFPGTGETGKIYIAIDTAKTYRWSGSAYVEISASPGSTDAVPEGSTNLYFTNSRARGAITATGSLSYNNQTGVLSYTQPTNVSTFTNDSGYLTGITGTQVANALGYTPPQPNGTGASGTWNISIAGNAATVSSITSGQVTTALGYTPYNSSNPSGYITSSSLSSYLPLSGGTVSGGTTFSSTVYFGTDIQLTRSDVSPALLFTNQNQWRWIYNGGGNYWQTNLSIVSGGNNIAINGNAALHAANYNSYSPTLTGTGASGTWAINITGNAATATSATDSTKLPLSGGTMTGSIDVTSGQNVRFGHASQSDGNDGKIGAALFDSGLNIVGTQTSPGGGRIIRLWGTVVDSSGYSFLNSANYTSFSPTLTGGGASGTWGINITGQSTSCSGNAATASNISNGGTVTLASAGEANAITITQPSYTTDTPVKLLNFDWYGNMFSISNIRSGDTASNGLGFYYTPSGGSRTEIARFRSNASFNVVGAITQNGSQVLHAGNYTSYSPSLTGSGASGTWGINVTGSSASTTGNAATASRVVYQGNRTAETGSTVSTPSDRIDFVGAYDNGYPATYGNVMSIRGGGVSQLYLGWNGGSSAATGDLYYRSMTDWMDGWGSWRRVLNDSNYSSYALPLSGGSVSGAINLTNRVNGILVNSSSTASDGGAIAIQQVTSEGWTGIFADYEPYTGWGLWHDNPNNYFCFTAESATGGLRSFTVPSRVSGNRTAYEKVRIEQSSGDVRVGGSVYITTSGHLALHAGNSSDYQSRSIKAVRTSNVNFNSLNTAVDTFTAGTNYIPNGGAYNQPADGDHHYLSWGGIEGQNVWGAQIDINFYDDRMWFRRQNGADWQAWRNVLHDGNYGSYALPLSGGAVTGTVTFGSFLRIASDNSDWGTGNYFRGQSNHFVLGVQSGGTLYLNYGNSAGTTRIEGTTLINGNTALHAANYNSYSPTLTGGGASGTWGINITGNAATATSATDSTKLPLSGGTITGDLNINSARITVNSGGVNTYGIFSGYNNNNHMIVCRGQVTGSVTSPSISGSHQQTFIEYAEANDSTGWFFKSSQPGTYAEVARITRSQINWNGNTVLHAGNYTSYSPSLTGSGASGTWSINVTGTSANTSGYSTYLPTRYDGGQQLNPQTYFGQGIGLRVAMTAAAGYWSDTMWINGYAGGDVLSMCALHTSRQGTPRMWISTQTSTGTSYGTLYEFLSTYNYNSYSPTLTGGGASGTWGISITGNAATVGSRGVGNSYGNIAYFDGSGNLFVNNPESYSGEVRLGAAWGRGGVYGSNGVTVSTSGSFIDHVHGNNVSMRHVYDGNGSRVIIGSGQTSTPYTLVDSNARPTLYMRGAYPVLVLDHTATSNGSHGPTIQFAHDGVGARQWLVGTNGTGTRIDFGYADSGTGNTNYNPHNGISGYLGTTWMTVRNNGRIGLGWEGDWGDYGANGEPLYPFHFIGSHQNSHTYLFRNTTSASNGCGAIFVNTHGNHSWGICSEFRIDGSSGSDRPSILFSSGYNSETWSVGFGYTDSNFRINRDHGHRNGGWGTTLMVMDRSGNVTFSGNVTAYSDRRLKTDIKRIENAGDIVRRLEGVSFKYREDGRDGIGLIAQDVELVLPQIVGEATSSDGSTHKNVAYGNVVAVLIEAIKELQDEVASLKSTLH